MATYYSDSSVLVKRHVVEVGTAWVQALTDPVAGNRFITAELTQVEGLSTLNRRWRNSTVAPARYRLLAAVRAGLA